MPTEDSFKSDKFFVADASPSRRREVEAGIEILKKVKEKFGDKNSRRIFAVRSKKLESSSTYWTLF